jgi:hypothetical protein
MDQLLTIAQVGGPSVFYLLCLLLLIALAIILQRTLYFRLSRVEASVLGRELALYARHRDESGARDLLHQVRGVEAEVLRELTKFSQCKSPWFFVNNPPSNFKIMHTHHPTLQKCSNPMGTRHYNMCWITTL